jgi:TnpA family transposase
VALKRLVGFSAKNRFYRANRDLGRIFKTEFILRYLSKLALRRRIRRGLLKVEPTRRLGRGRLLRSGGIGLMPASDGSRLTPAAA